MIPFILNKKGFVFLHKILQQNIPSTSLLFFLSFRFSLYPEGGPGFWLISCKKIDIKYANSCIKVSSDCRIYRLGVCVHAYRSSAHVHTSLSGGWVEASPMLSHWKSDKPKTNVWWLFLMYRGVNKQHGNNGSLSYSDLLRQPFRLKDHHDRKAMTPFCYFLYFTENWPEKKCFFPARIISSFLDNPDVVVGEVLLSLDLLIKSLPAFTCEINHLFVVWMGCWDLSVKSRWEKLMQLCAGISTNPQGSTQTPSRGVWLCVCEHIWNVRALVMLSQCAIWIACYGDGEKLDSLNSGKTMPSETPPWSHNLSWQLVHNSILLPESCALHCLLAKNVLFLSLTFQYCTISILYICCDFTCIYREC